MASPFDVTEFTAKERNAARKDLLKKIEHYNKKMKKTRDLSFPLSPPTTDLVYRGVLKVTYDRGYAIQTKSVLVESTLTAEDLIDQLIDSLGLTGGVDDYILEERNHMTQSTRTINKTEFPLSLQLQYGPHSSILEIRMVQIRKNRVTINKEEIDSDDDEQIRQKRGSIIPKDEDHGTANVESMMDEVLQDVPIMVSDVQEKLKLLSETVATEGKPQNNLPSRRSLWDILKPQVSSLVKDIRRLVDNEESLTTKHCPSEEFRLIVTLLLELITDYSRELITVTKELCGLKGAAKTDFNSSVSSFVQQITYISKLVGRSCSCLHAAALSGHLFHATAPGNFLKGPLEEDSLFIGSGSTSGVLIFSTTTAFIGLIRAAYEDKSEHYAGLANNMLQSTKRALQTVQKTNDYVLIHLHPLRSRITDMEHKLKVSMDTLVRKVKAAASIQPPPVSIPEMLLSGHNLIIATLDYLLVAQCASLLHKLTVKGSELLELPWVQGWVSTTTKDKSTEGFTEPKQTPHTGDQLSSTSDSATERSFGTVSTASSSGRHLKERKSRITSGHKETATSADSNDEGNSAVLEHLTLQPGHLPLNYNSEESGEDADDEAGRSENYKGTSTASHLSPTSPIKPLLPHLFSNSNSKYMGISAVQQLRNHQLLNKAIAKVAEGLLLTVTQNVHHLSQQCQEDSKEQYSNTVEILMEATKHLQEEVSVMECDLGGSKSMKDAIVFSSQKFESIARDIYMSLSSATSPHACDKDRLRLMAASAQLNDLCSTTVRDALTLVADHKKALEQAERLEEEFVALMTGYKIKNSTSKLTLSDSSPSRSRRGIGNIKLKSDQDAEKVLFEELPSKKFVPGGIWSRPISPKVIGGTLNNLIQRLTYYRVVDSEFAKSFILSFHHYVSNEYLFQTLVDNYHIEKPQELNEIDQETFELDKVIPVRLRIVHAFRLWLQYHPADFSPDSALKMRLQIFLKEMESNMSSCCQHLIALLEGNHSTHKVPKLISQPILPQIQGELFSIMECNTLELARQLCLVYHRIYSKVQLKEFLILTTEQSEGWKEKVPGLHSAKIFSKNLSKLVSSLLSNGNEDDQSLVLSYFIKTAENCHHLKNYEAISVIVSGLTSDIIRQSTRGAWQLLGDNQIQLFKSLREVVSRDMNFQYYRSEIKNACSTACIPLIDTVLHDISAIHHNLPDKLPGHTDTLNFVKWRQFSQVLSNFHSILTTPYGFVAIEVIQEYMENLKTVK